MENIEHLLSIDVSAAAAIRGNLTSQDIPCHSTPLEGHSSRLKDLRPHFGIPGCRGREEQCCRFRQFRAAHRFGRCNCVVRMAAFVPGPISFGKIRLRHLVPSMSKTDQESINLSAQDKVRADKATPPVNENLNLHHKM